MMKKQQWLFNVVFSSTSSFNSVRLRPFCSAAAATATTKTNLVAPSTDAPPVKNSTSQLQKLKILLEKKLPLLIVPYDHVTEQKYVQFPHRSLDGGGFICDGNLGFISLFEHDDEDQQINNNNKEKKKQQLEELVVYERYLRKTVKRRICGSSEGWLVTIHRKGKIHLLNPVTKVRVELPPLTAIPGVAYEFISDHEQTKGKLSYLTDFNSDKPPYYKVSNSHEFREDFIYKVVTNTTTSTNPATVVVVIIYSMYERLAFCRMSLSSTGNGTDEPAAKRWIEITGNEPPLTAKEGSWEDVTFYKGHFYAVDNSGDVVVVKGLDGSSPFMQRVIDGPVAEPKSFTNYLVESPSSSSSGGGGGDLLMVMRNIETREETDKEEEEVEETKEEEEVEETKKEEEDETEEKEEIFEHPYRTVGFNVWKLNLNGPSWEEVTDLGEDVALFIGYNQSFSISTSKFPGCRGNCIYFTDDTQWDTIYPTGGHDIGVYNLEDGSFEKLYETSSSRQLFMPPPVWYVPN